MSFIVTPGRLNRQAEFYRQISILLGAGFGLLPALQQLRSRPPDAEVFRLATSLLDHLGQGLTLTDALVHTGNQVPSFDTALLSAGERSGRLDGIFRLLSDYYEDRARMMRQVIGDLAYPVFLFHFAILIFPFSELFTTGNVLVYAGKTLGILLPVYAAAFALIYAAQGRHGEVWRSKIESVVRFIPVLGKARHELGLARLAAALEALITAGIPAYDAWFLAAKACGSLALQREIESWKPRFAKGSTPAELLLKSGQFPDLFARLYHSGEVTGKLDQELKHLHFLYQEQGTHKLHMVAQWLPRLVYLLIALMIAFKVISFYQDYFNKINAATEM